VRLIKTHMMVPFYMCNKIDLIQNLKHQIEANEIQISKLEYENEQFVEMMTVKEMAEKDIQMLKQELLNDKVEHNKFKMMYNSSTFDNYEQSLKDANSNLCEAKEQIENLLESHKEDINNVPFFFNYYID
jgi:vacuolar-type H+-ATPase subunit I/STV1